MLSKMALRSRDLYTLYNTNVTRGSGCKNDAPLKVVYERALILVVRCDEKCIADVGVWCFGAATAD